MGGTGSGAKSPYTKEAKLAAIERARVIGFKRAGLEMVPPVSDTCVNLWRRRLKVPKFLSPGHRLWREGRRGMSEAGRQQMPPAPVEVPTTLPAILDPFLRADPCLRCQGSTYAEDGKARCPGCVLYWCGRPTLIAGLAPMPAKNMKRKLNWDGHWVPVEHECYGCHGRGRWRVELGSQELRRCGACRGSGRCERDRLKEIKDGHRRRKTRSRINIPVAGEGKSQPRARLEGS